MRHLYIESANKVYDILVSVCGAYESDRELFVNNHCDEKEVTMEWRFVGNLGFGGKYRSQTNRVDCYNEDLNGKREMIIKIANNLLSMIPENELYYE